MAKNLVYSSISNVIKPMAKYPRFLSHTRVIRGKPKRFAPPLPGTHASTSPKTILTNGTTSNRLHQPVVPTSCRRRITKMTNTIPASNPMSIPTILATIIPTMPPTIMPIAKRRPCAAANIKIPTPMPSNTLQARKLSRAKRPLGDHGLERSTSSWATTISILLISSSHEYISLQKPDSQLHRMHSNIPYIAFPPLRAR